VACNTAEGGSLWNCTECSSWFHEQCAGYREGSLCLPQHLHDSQIIEMRVLCNGCVCTLALDQDDVTREIEEKRVVAGFLNEPDCPFLLRKVGHDGASCFRVLFEFAVAQLAYKSTFAVYCRQLAVAALKTILEAAEIDATESANAVQLKRISRSRNPPRDLQNGAGVHIEAQHLLHGFVALFPAVRVRVFAVAEDDAAERAVYGEGAQALCVLHWRVLEQFDELVRR
jgi:hypothetical protein